MSAPVAINARAAVRKEVGGVERVARELSQRLPVLRPDRYRVIQPAPWLAHRRGQVWEQLALPALARGSELILSPANLAPLASRRNLIWIHDVAPLQADWYSAAYGRWHRALLPRLARRARRVVTVSETARAEIVDLLGVPANRTSVVPPGVDPRFSPDADPAPVAVRHRLERPYVLALGTEIPRKNFGLLDRVAETLAAEGIEIVLAGSTRAYMPSGAHGLRRLGYVADADLPGLYAGAAALAMPSLYEGFGLPCLEAMACGTPVVASDRGALPETCGGAALLCDPRDADGFAAALLRAAGPERERLRTAGLARVSGFTWERTAELADRVVGELLTGPSLAPSRVQ